MQKQSDKLRPTAQINKKKRVSSVWQIVNATANDNTPSFSFWLTRILGVSLFFFGIIYYISLWI